MNREIVCLTNGKSVLIANFIIILCGCIGFINSRMVAPCSILAVVALFYAVNKNIIQFCLPPLIMFYEFLVIPGGLSVFRVYTILFLFLQFSNRNVRINEKRNLIFLIISTISLIFSLEVESIRRILFLFFDLIAMVLYVNDIKENRELFHYFSYSMIAAVFFACLVGVVIGISETSAIYLGGQWIENSRLIATFKDPNYLSLFINLAFFFAMIETSIPLFIRIPTLIGLLFFLIATGSLTGVLALVLGIVMYLLFLNKINFKTLIVVVISLLLLRWIYQYALSHDVMFLSGFLQRIQSKVQVGNDINAITSNRTRIWEEHWAFYKNQSVFKQLFGGNIISASLLDTKVFHYVSHQDYVDILLCFGLIGFVLIIPPNFIHMLSVGRNAMRTADHVDMSICLMKVLYFVYAFGLTMLLDPKFLLIMLI